MSNTWWDAINHPRFVVAPMVDASELAWRTLSRRHGAQLCYTPMLHSYVFSRDARYRNEALISTEEDRPLIAQFCGNDADSLLQSALLAQPYCDAIDINLGCPQAIAKRGHYGAFLQDDWPLLTKIVSTLRKSLSVPVTCKIRVYESIEKTVSYAKMLEAAGCQLLTVHGRTKEQKGPLTGLASWDHIKAVKENVSIPVLANGNIQCLQDLERCMEVTNCDGVMSAEGNLYNPAIFESRYPLSWEMALEYLELAEQYPCPLSYVRGHLFKLFHHVLCLPINKNLRSDLATKGSIEDFRNIALAIRERYKDFHEGSAVWLDGYGDNYDLKLPPWLCQSYVRPAPEEYLKKMAELQNRVNRNNDTTSDHKSDDDEDEEEGAPSKRPRDSSLEGSGENISKKKYKKLKKHSEKVTQIRRTVVICSSAAECPNPMGLKCLFKLCKVCCRIKCYEEDRDCVGHGILIKTRREKAKMYSSLEKGEIKKISDDFRESNIIDDRLIKVV